MEWHAPCNHERASSCYLRRLAATIRLPRRYRRHELGLASLVHKTERGVGPKVGPQSGVLPT